MIKTHCRKTEIRIREEEESSSRDEGAYNSGDKGRWIAEYGRDDELHGHSCDFAAFLDFAFAAATVVMLKCVLQSQAFTVLSFVQISPILHQHLPHARYVEIVLFARRPAFYLFFDNRNFRLSKPKHPYEGYFDLFLFGFYSHPYLSVTKIIVYKNYIF